MKSRALRMFCAALIVLCLLPAAGLAAMYPITTPFPLPVSLLNINAPLVAEQGATVNVYIVRNTGWIITEVRAVETGATANRYPVTFMGNTTYQFPMPPHPTSIEIDAEIIEPFIRVEEGVTEIPYGGSLTLRMTNTGNYGDGAYVYWTHNGLPVPGASDALFSVSLAGDYRAVVGQDGFTRPSAAITLTMGLSPEKDIVAFSIFGQVGATVIQGTSITVTMPHGTDVTAPAPAITLSEHAVVDPASGIARDFTSPQVYTVTAQDDTQATYTVTVQLQPPPLPSIKEITAFTIPGQVGGTVIQGTSIAVTMPHDTDVTALTPAITHTGAAIVPQGGIPQDFTAPVTYTVTARDGTQATYTAAVTTAPDPGPNPPAQGGITAFTMPGQVGKTAITADTIALTMPHGTNLTSLPPTIVYTGIAITPHSGTPKNFSNPITYTVTLEDLTTKPYTVTVTLAPAPAPIPDPPMGGPGHEPIQPEPKVYQKATVTAKASVYHSPGGGVAGQVYEGEVIELLQWDEDSLHCRIRFDDSSRVGWLHGDFIMPMEP